MVARSRGWRLSAHAYAKYAHPHTSTHTGVQLCLLVGWKSPSKMGAVFLHMTKCWRGGLGTGIDFWIEECSSSYVSSSPCSFPLSSSPPLCLLMLAFSVCVCVSVCLPACLPECISSREAQRESGSHSARLKTKTRSAMHRRLNTEHTFTHTHKSTFT